jgi:hypothetical protein
MADRFSIEISNKKRLTPMKSGTELLKAPTHFNATKQAKKQYQELIGSMMWPTTITVVKLGAAAGALRSSRQTTLVCVNAPPVGASVCVCHFTLLQR